MPSIRDEFGRILDLRSSLARDQCASQTICALRVGPNRGKTPKSCPFKNEGIPEMHEVLTVFSYPVSRLTKSNQSYLIDPSTLGQAKSGKTYCFVLYIE